MVHGPPSPMRRVLAVVATAAASAFGALILGEYELVGFTPYIAGALFGLSVAEVALAIGRDARRPAAAITGLLCTVGLVWAAWISSGRVFSRVTVGAWSGCALGGAVAMVWVSWSGRRGARSRATP